jgi:hypothetical protein
MVLAPIVRFPLSPRREGIETYICISFDEARVPQPPQVSGLPDSFGLSEFPRSVSFNTNIVSIRSSRAGRLTV